MFGHSLSILIHIHRQILKYDIAFECTNEERKTKNEREKEPFRAQKILICIVILIGMFNFIKFYGYFRKTTKRISYSWDFVSFVYVCLRARLFVCVREGGNGREVTKMGCTMNEFYECRFWGLWLGYRVVCRRLGMLFICIWVWAWLILDKDQRNHRRGLLFSNDLQLLDKLFEVKG